MEHTSIVEDKFNQLTIKFCVLEEDKDAIDKEMKIYKRKETQYNLALQEKIQAQMKIDDQIVKINRLTDWNRKYETTNKILNADNTQLKEEILRYTERNAQLERDKVKLQNTIDALELKIKSYDLDLDDFKSRETKMKELIEVMEMKIGNMTEEIQNKTIDLDVLTAKHDL